MLIGLVLLAMVIYLVIWFYRIKGNGDIYSDY